MKRDIGLVIEIGPFVIDVHRRYQERGQWLFMVWEKGKVQRNFRGKIFNRRKEALAAARTWIVPGSELNPTLEWCDGPSCWFATRGAGNTDSSDSRSFVAGARILEVHVVVQADCRDRRHQRQFSYPRGSCSGGKRLDHDEASC